MANYSEIHEHVNFRTVEPLYVEIIRRNDRQDF
jgi:hypothetical protein